MGHDFSRVRVVQDDPAVAALGASAVTRGEQIRFAPHQFRPDHPRGVTLIGHELAHVAQQRLGGGSGSPPQQREAEREAERAGQRASQGLPTRIVQSGHGVQPRMGFEFQGSNTIEYGYDLDSASPRWEPAPRKSAVFHGRSGPPRVRLEPDSRGDFEFVTHPHSSRRLLIGEVQEAATLTEHILSWPTLPGEPNHTRLAQRHHGPDPVAHRRIHRGASWSTMEQVNSQKRGARADAVRIHIVDRRFGALPQVTEGIRLERIEGFLAQNLGSAEPEAGRAGAIRTSVDRAVGDPAVAAAASALSPLERAQVRGFLSMVLALFSYARRVEPGNPVIKEAFPILHRTRVSAMYAALGSGAQRFVRDHAFPAGSPFLRALGAERSERIFLRGYDSERSVARREAGRGPGSGAPERGGFRGPTLGEWLDSIVRPRAGRGGGRADRMSPLRHGTRSMGALGMDEAPDGTASLVVLEVRNWGPRLEQAYRADFTRAYRREQDEIEEAERAGRPRPLITVPWRPGDPVPNWIPAALWVRWAQARLADADAGGRGDNLTP